MGVVQPEDVEDGVGVGKGVTSVVLCNWEGASGVPLVEGRCKGVLLSDTQCVRSKTRNFSLGKMVSAPFQTLKVFCHPSGKTLGRYIQ